MRRMNPALAARLQPAVQRGARAADVQVAGGTGGEAGADGHRGLESGSGGFYRSAARGPGHDFRRMARVPARLRDIGEVPFPRIPRMHQRAFAAFLALLLAGSAFAADKDADKDASDTQADKPDPMLGGTAIVGKRRQRGRRGRRIDYRAVAGTLVLHDQGRQGGRADRQHVLHRLLPEGRRPQAPDHLHLQRRPGLGHGLAAHMGAFGPVRVVTSDDSHARRRMLVNNDFSLLDSDLVFIDAPGAGFSRLIAADGTGQARRPDEGTAASEIYSVDGDGPFAQFVTLFLSKYGLELARPVRRLRHHPLGGARQPPTENQRRPQRRDPALADPQFRHQHRRAGVQPEASTCPELALPTFAATAYYHHVLPRQPRWTVPARGRQYAMGEYASALMQGASLDDAQNRRWPRSCTNTPAR